VGKVWNGQFAYSLERNKKITGKITGEKGGPHREVSFEMGRTDEKSRYKKKGSNEGRRIESSSIKIADETRTPAGKPHSKISTTQKGKYIIRRFGGKTPLSYGVLNKQEGLTLPAKEPKSVE